MIFRKNNFVFFPSNHHVPKSNFDCFPHPIKIASKYLATSRLYSVVVGALLLVTAIFVIKLLFMRIK